MNADQRLRTSSMVFCAEFRMAWKVWSAFSCGISKCFKDLFFDVETDGALNPNFRQEWV